MGRCIVVYDLVTVQQRLVLQVKKLPDKILFSKNPDCLFMMYAGEEISQIKLDYAKRDASTTGMIEDTTILDFCLSHNNEKLLAVTELRLFVFKVASQELKATIAHMPQGFQETMTHFKEAAFTSGDSLIVALRYLHVAFWSAHTYTPLKAIQVAVHVPQRIITTPTANRFIVIQSDFSVQVWHPSSERVQCGVVQQQVHAGGAIVAMASATAGNRLITYGQGRPGKGVILDINKGVEEMVLDISESLPEDAKIKEVSFSPKGKYLITKVRDASVTSGATTDMVHAVITAKQAAAVSRCVFTQVSAQDDLALSMCLTANQYSIVATFLNEKDKENVHDSFLPDGELEGQPAFTENGEFLLFIYELKAQKDRVYHQRFPKPGRKLMLCTTIELMRTMSNKGKALQELDYASWKYMTEDDYLLAVYPLKADSVLLLFAEGVGKPDTKQDKEDFKTQQKLAVVYSVKSKRVTKFFKNFMNRDSDIEHLVFSSQGTFILDQLGRIYSSADNKLLNTIPLRGIDHRSTKFLFDGKFVITMTLDHHRIIIFTSDKSEIKASIPVHGVANTLQIAKDGQILIAACEDGRILLWRTLLDYSKMMGAASALVPTHKFPPAIKTRPLIPDERDEFVESVSMLDPREERVLRTADTSLKPAGGLAARLNTGPATSRGPGAASRWGKLRVQHAAGTFTHKKPSLTTLAKVVNITHRQANNKSRACVIQ